MQTKLLLRVKKLFNATSSLVHFAKSSITTFFFCSKSLGTNVWLYMIWTVLWLNQVGNSHLFTI